MKKTRIDELDNQLDDLYKNFRDTLSLIIIKTIQKKTVHFEETKKILQKTLDMMDLEKYKKDNG